MEKKEERKGGEERRGRELRSTESGAYTHSSSSHPMGVDCTQQLSPRNWRHVISPRPLWLWKDPGQV